MNRWQWSDLTSLSLLHVIVSGVFRGLCLHLNDLLASCKQHVGLGMMKNPMQNKEQILLSNYSTLIKFGIPLTEANVTNEIAGLDPLLTT